MIITPIKCQGKKTKIVPLIKKHVNWNGKGRWIEPFLGSGMVFFNMAGERAVGSDSNVFLINFFNEIKNGHTTSWQVKNYRESNSILLRTHGEEYYYTIRDKFNKYGSSLEFLFLNRTCFNGLIRFNSNGEFNVPFSKDKYKLKDSLIEKITAQIAEIETVMHKKKWFFRCCDWREALRNTKKNDFVYIDPPYIGRNTGYYNSWNDDDADELASRVQALECGWAVSIWKHDSKGNVNAHFKRRWNGFVEIGIDQYYCIGPRDTNRYKVREVLLIKPGFEKNITKG